MTSAEIITIGTEILLGEIVDTNTRYLARNLRGLGVDLYRTITIGDNEDRIVSAIRESMERADIVITTGGLGPTIDRCRAPAYSGRRHGAFPLLPERRLRIYGPRQPRDVGPSWAGLGRGHGRVA